MKSVMFLVPFIAAVAGNHVLFQAEQAKSDQQKMDINGETAYFNFIKVMAIILIHDPEPPMEVTQSVKTVMRNLMNKEPQKQGYFSYLTTSLLRVVGSPLSTQVDTVFNIIKSMNDESVPIYKAAATVQEFLQSRSSKVIYADIENYVTSLFQSIKTSAGHYSSHIELDFPRRPASGGRPGSRI